MAIAGRTAKQKTGSRFVVTSAVSGSRVHEPFLASLRQYCRENGAELLVVPIRYRNPTSAMERPEDWFDPMLTRNMIRDRVELCRGLILMADVSTQPTAVRPLSGMQNLSGDASAIYGHPKIALESIARGVTGLSKLVMTTGAVTQPVYSKTKAGKKGEFHHVLGAVVVEIDGNAWHARHINASRDGSFVDLDRKYSRSGAKRESHAQALALGDLHGVRHDPSVLQATIFADDSIAKTLMPEVIVLHDVLDFHSASHHNDYFDRVRLFHETTQGKSFGNVAAELGTTLALLDRIIEETGSRLIVVASNHDSHFYRWLEDARNAQDLQNAEIYHETKLELVKAAIQQRHADPLVYWASKLMKHFCQATFLAPEDSYEIDGVEYSQHGDKGINGARGSLHGYTRAGIKMVIGHSHTPGIADGIYQCGTSSLLKMGYNQGLSGWRHTHCVQYSSGKRALINIVDGQWRAQPVAQGAEAA
jgi:hypothetical protein